MVQEPIETKFVSILKNDNFDGLQMLRIDRIRPQRTISSDEITNADVMSVKM